MAKRQLRLAFHGLSAVLLSIGVGNAHAQPVSAPSGQGFDVEHYSVSIRPDLATTVISGSEAITFRAVRDGLSRLQFSPNALRISAATLDGLSVKATSSVDGIAFDLPKPLRRGQRATLRFHIDGKPARGVSTAAGSIFTGYFACDWMVCLQDAPGDKAQLSLDLLLPPGLQSAGPGRVRKSTLGSGHIRHSWRSTRPYSPYLYAFAAGPFVRSSLRTSNGEFTYLDATGRSPDLTGVYVQTGGLASFFARMAGVALPDRRYTQIVVSGREAQETAGFSLIGVDELDRERGDPNSTWIVAHEMAHQWWGNLVTCRTWQDLWLNEGIATFMVAAWKENSSGTGTYRDELDAARRRVERVRALGFDRPLTWSGKYPSLAARRAVQYSKGALFLAHLRETIGDQVFWNGLRRFTRRHAGGTVTSRDFQTAMERASRRDLSAVFDEWVYGTSGT